MLVWSKDGTFFVYLEKCQTFYLSQFPFPVNGEPAKYYTVMADDNSLGRVETLDEGKEILRKIAMAFRTASVECDPW